MGEPNVATARAHSNIAFVKYWGNSDQRLRLPANSSLSMNLDRLHTTTTVQWSLDYGLDSVTINGRPADAAALRRVRKHLQLLRDRFKTKMFARVQSRNNFPMGTGIASSASSFAALTLAGAAALGEQLSQRELSTIARRGSGSAARSIPSGYVEWFAAVSHELSYAETFVDYDYWELVDVIAIVSRAHKRIGSTAGHVSADTSILQKTRIENAPQRLDRVKNAIVNRDFVQFARVVEEDSNLMHAVMMTGRPALFYWQPTSLAIMNAVRQWREEDGIQVCYTLDAGPNVHCICVKKDAEAVKTRLSQISDAIEVLSASAGQGAFVLDKDAG